jgi:phosphatidylserine/phosphatidylglycerophosphate/cardiolipin synthase-like enzyme
MDFFRVLLEKDVMVRIYTRPPSQQSGSLSEHAEQVINQFENLGSKVIQRKGMHQKIAIIDGKIAWEGSLNITKSQRHQGADAPF